MTTPKRSSQKTSIPKGKRVALQKDIDHIKHDWLFGPLNKENPSQADERVRTIFRLMLELDRLLKELTAYKRLHYSEPGPRHMGYDVLGIALSKFLQHSPMQAAWQRFLEASKQLNERLALYTAHPKIFLWTDDLSPWKLQIDVSAKEFRSIREIVSVAERGDLDRFRRCDNCSDWFLARVDHQRCCNLACRQKLHRNSPEFRAQRRLYMRKLRRLHKNKVFVSNYPERARGAAKAAKPKGR
jgi:hypothetical protein